MKLMAFVGSPRRGSNTDLLTDSAIAGAQSVQTVETEKVYVYDTGIKTCTGCMLCTALKGSQPCPLADAMGGILERMAAADAFIFGTPNHAHVPSAGMVNLFCRMQPLLTMNVIRDAAGAIVGADAVSRVRGRRAVVIVTQGDFSYTQSALIFRAIDSNMRDFQLKKVAEVFSAGNLEPAAVRDKAADLQAAFAAGAKLAGPVARSDA